METYCGLTLFDQIIMRAFFRWIGSKGARNLGVVRLGCGESTLTFLATP